MKKLLTVATTLMLTISVCVPTISKAAIQARTIGIFSTDSKRDGLARKSHQRKNIRKCVNPTIIPN